jgi:glucose-1-phosphate thymidylyltransferase
MERVNYMKAIILGAGYATRLYPLTKSMPKALLKIKGETILNHILKKVEEIKQINEIIIVTNQKFYKDFLAWKKQYKGKLPVDIINDLTTSNENRLGAIADIELTIKTKKINEDALIVASDNYFDFDLVEIYNHYRKQNADLIIGSIASKEILEQRKYGVAQLNKDNKVISFEEKPTNPKSNIIVHALYLYKKETIPLFKQYLDEGNPKDAPGNFITWLHKKKPLYCYKAQGTCYDIGTIDIYNELNK